MRISGLRRLAVLVGLAAGVALALAAMPGCGSDCPTPEQRTYLKEVEDWTERSKASTEELAAIGREVGNRPEAFLDEEWRRRLRSTFDEQASISDEMINVNVPVGAEEVRRSIVRFSEETAHVNELFWQGVLDVDAELLNKSNVRRRESARLLEEVSIAIERMCE